MTRRASVPLESTVRDVWVASLTCSLMNASHPFQYSYQKILHVDASSVTSRHCYSNRIFCDISVTIVKIYLPTRACRLEHKIV